MLIPYRCLISFCLSFIFSFVVAIGQNASISFSPGPNAIKLASCNSSVKIIADGAEWPAVLNAAQNLATDFGLVTGKNGTLFLHKGIRGNLTASRPSLTFQAERWSSWAGTSILNATTSWNSTTSWNAATGRNHTKPVDDAGAIIVGTKGSSVLIDDLFKSGKLDARNLEGAWETYLLGFVDEPMAGVRRALVIAGSDRRGTVYGIYDIAEQIGVSPWYWFADVPPQRHDVIYGLNTTRKQGPPTVKYRGFFINDEAPSLTGWVNAKYQNSRPGPAFISEFYVRVFELLLRLRANYLWPAMWQSMFNVDDPNNQALADEYGIVMGTSHTEPMMRATKEQADLMPGVWQWDVNNASMKDFMLEGAKRAKPYESLFTMGARGNHDTALNGGDAIKQLQGIFKAEREILSEVYGDKRKVPQLWTLYTEVQSYYDDDGFTVPDDITLLWSDDNYGNMRRLPVGNEKNRVGGAGVYYHFDFVGPPRCYKWINTIQLQRTWEQMRFAYERKATQIWIVNVGDIKGLEIPISHFLDMAYDMDLHKEPEDTTRWVRSWATREFGEVSARSVQDILIRYSFLAGRRKFELVDTSTYSVINYGEADTVLGEWRNLSTAAQSLYDRLPEDCQAAFFEMLLHPILAAKAVHEVVIASAKNQLYASQGRNSALAMAEHVAVNWRLDHELTRRYHTLLGGKWDHMMDQTHFYNNHWQQPMQNFIPPLHYIQSLEGSLSGDMGIAIEGSNASIPGDDRFHPNSADTLTFPGMSPYDKSPRWFEIYAQGPRGFDFNITAESYIRLSQTTRRISPDVNASDVRIWVSVDWNLAPLGIGEARLNISSSGGYGTQYKSPYILVPFRNSYIPSSFNQGFVESDGAVSFEAEHHTRTTAGTFFATYYTIPSYGKTLSGVTLTDRNAPFVAPGSGPSLEYDFYAFTDATKRAANISVILGQSLNTNPKRPLRYAVAIDDLRPRVVQYIIERQKSARASGSMPFGWEQAVIDAAWVSETSFKFAPGKHTLKFWALEPGVVLQKIVIDLGGVRKSYLGPPESYRVDSHSV
ncbi:hypothetical protein EJ08DRAFT_725966 [Tothia fuscella]|uniref:Gylcosyl hydrolase 115 C-terminal domain-containing protein n=1 Tax=Tothia fuscella TaxID=1048955 RepID=A0A9P4NHU1_9PEZI|nr:hypothetical protein EJ08DRAFT_725966 [Tothia fuscella]